MHIRPGIEPGGEIKRRFRMGIGQGGAEQRPEQDLMDDPVAQKVRGPKRKPRRDRRGEPAEPSPGKPGAKAQSRQQRPGMANAMTGGVEEELQRLVHEVRTVGRQKQKKRLDPVENDPPGQRAQGGVSEQHFVKRPGASLLNNYDDIIKEIIINTECYP